MNFDFSDEEKRVQRAARELLEKSSPLSHVRQILDARSPYDTELWSVLAEMGWMGVAVASEHGGIDSGYLELALIAEELGRSLAAVPSYCSTATTSTPRLQRSPVQGARS